MSGLVNEPNLREFYQHVFPVSDLTKWLSYDIGGGTSVDARGCLARREFCFTLIGDIFTRFRSYTSEQELRAELVKCYPEKIDVGAVYNVRPSQKANTTIVPLERELIFDIDMSDYDKVRSCCKGKAICKHCWTWMSCAVNILADILRDDFGFKYLLPVFSGRRGIHLWVCDRRARQLPDDERRAIVGYMSVIRGDNTTAVSKDLVAQRPIHPSLEDAQRRHLCKAFEKVFLTADPATNRNSVAGPEGAAVIYSALENVLKGTGKWDKVAAKLKYADGEGLDWHRLQSALGPDFDGVVAAVQFLVLYPRLDEHVSTRQDHLLKLPFCVHPGTGSLCTPLTWGQQLESFDPLVDAPKLDALLLSRSIGDEWLAPLRSMLEAMSLDENERRASTSSP
jgi:DNA primase small subunit